MTVPDEIVWALVFGFFAQTFIAWYFGMECHRLENRIMELRVYLSRSKEVEE